MPSPKDVTKLRSDLIVRLLSHYGNFVKEMRALCAQLDAFLAKYAKFVWTAACHNSFNREKRFYALMDF